MSKRHYIIPIFVSHQGCPHNCVFCNQNSITGSCEVIDGEYVKNIIEEYLGTIDKQNSTIEVSFFGGTFTAIHMDMQKELLSVAKYYKDCGKINFIRLSTRPDYIDKVILDNLKIHSVDIIELGVQSMDEDVLIKSGRGHSKEDVIRASKLIKDYGFTLGHQVMLGLPGDTPEKDVKTVNELIALNPDLFRIYPALVIKDTPMEILFNHGKYKPYDLSTAVEVSKQLYCLLINKNINIIRVGLQATDNINVGKDIIAGPFHPAFRELVEGSIYCDMIMDVCRDCIGDIQIRINEKELSKLYANKKQFFVDMKRQLNTIKLVVYTDSDVKRGSLDIKCGSKCCNMSINDYARKTVIEGKIDIS